MAEQWNRVVYSQELGELGGVNLTNDPATTITEGSSGAGSAETAARADHVHGYTEPDVPDPSPSAPIAIDGEASDVGTESEFARGDHAHGFSPQVALDFNQQQMQNARIHNTATAPSNPQIGQIYINPTTGQTFIWADV